MGSKSPDGSEGGPVAGPAAILLVGRSLYSAVRQYGRAAIMANIVCHVP